MKLLAGGGGVWHLKFILGSEFDDQQDQQQNKQGHLNERNEDIVAQEVQVDSQQLIKAAHLLAHRRTDTKRCVAIGIVEIAHRQQNRVERFHAG